MAAKAKVAGAPEIQFATTFGDLDGTGKMSLKKQAVVNVPVVVVLGAEMAGQSTLEASLVDNNSEYDSQQIAISLPPEDAAWIELQAEPSIIPKKTGNTAKTVTLEATVRSIDDQVVGGAPVIFTILNPTGGGEFISPVIAYTDSSGKAQATFTPGTLSTDSAGVTVQASIPDSATVETGSVSIIIGGTAGSVVIGRANRVTSVKEDTAYDLQISVLVVDASGNAVVNTTVSMSVWPVDYAQGEWEDIAGDGIQDCVPVREAVFGNEDKNRNLILDVGEDVDDDGILTPSSSSSGSLSPAGDVQVKTDANGVASFTLIYLKSSSGWIRAELVASALVYGTETKGTSMFWLPFLLLDGGIKCSLPTSPYNEEKPVDQISVTATPNKLVPDGESESALRASVTDQDGDPVADNTRITFGITGGTTHGGLPNASTAVAYTASGIATTTYRAGYSTGVVEVTARADNGKDGTVEIELNEGGITLTATPEKLLSDGDSRSSIIATVVDAREKPVPDYTRVNFLITRGSGGLPYSSSDYAYTTGGIATADYEAGETPGTVEITASIPHRGYPEGRTDVVQGGACPLGGFQCPYRQWRKRNCHNGKGYRH